MSRPRFDYFQTDGDVTLSIMKRNVELASCLVAFSNNYITVYAGEEVIFEGQLAGTVDQDNFTVKCTPAKVEVKMPKTQHGRWSSLIATDAAAASTSGPAAAASNPFVTKNWDAIEKEAVKEEDSEDLEGDAAVNRMFKKIYENASDDVKKAMIKSYSESGGTVLSTNWSEISQKKTEVKPPDSMEYKKYEQ